MAYIQPGGRFVQQHNRRLLGQHHRNPRPLALPAGEGVYALRRQVGNTRGLHCFGHRRFVLFTPAGKERLVRIAPARDQLLHRNIPRRRGVLRQQSDPARHLFAGEALDLLAIKKYVAVQRGHQTAQGTQQRRFSTAVGADNGGKVAVGDRHLQILGHGFFAVAEGQIFAAQAGCSLCHFLRDS